jgi:hypothetical protein
MGCILFGIVGFGLIVVALRPLAPVALRVMDLIASQFDEMPERELMPIRVDRQQRRGP